MGHHDDGAGLVVNHRQPPVVADQTHRHQQVVQHTLALQQHDPAGRAHQKRGPEWQQHQDHQQVGFCHRQRRQQMGHRKGQQQAQQRDHARQHEGLQKQELVDTLVLGHELDAAVFGPFQIGRNQIEIRRGRARGRPHRLPQQRRAPGLVLGQQRLLERRCQLVRRPRGRGEQRPGARDVVIDPRAGFSGGLVLFHLGKIGGQGGKGSLVRLGAGRIVGKPGRKGRRGGRKAIMINGSVQHLTDRQDEGQHHEQQQRQNQQEGPPFCLDLGFAQRGFQRAAIACGQQRGRRCRCRCGKFCHAGPSGGRNRGGVLRRPGLSDQFAASQALKRSFSSESRSTQNS